MRRLLSVGFFLFLVSGAWHLGGQIYQVLHFPSHLRLLPGQQYLLDLGPLFQIETGRSEWIADLGSGGLAIQAPEEEGLRDDLRLSIFGIPIRTAQVDVVPRLYLVPGGQAVGVLMGDGVLVTRLSSVTGVGGRREPAREAGIRPGDIIRSVGNQPISHGGQLEELAQQYGQRGEPMPVTIERNGVRLQVEVIPHLAEVDGEQKYMIGVWVRDTAAGVGTLTFWDPATGRYGALGHQITSGPASAEGGLSIGRLVDATIQGINPGARGIPGEKIGVFDHGSAPLGTIDTNSIFGIFGNLERSPVGTAEALPVALAHEVKPGPATILTVIDGRTVESFEIEILQVRQQSRPHDKGLVIQVTDPRLLERTNGIVQGMSGSPILQDGYIVGAVTHVFVNDPTRGYGVLAEWMVYEAGLALPDPIRGDAENLPPAA